MGVTGTELKADMICDTWAATPPNGSGEVFILHPITGRAAGVVLRHVVSPGSCEVVWRAGGR